MIKLRWHWKAEFGIFFWSSESSHTPPHWWCVWLWWGIIHQWKPCDGNLINDDFDLFEFRLADDPRVWKNMSCITIRSHRGTDKRTGLFGFFPFLCKGFSSLVEIYLFKPKHISWQAWTILLFIHLFFVREGWAGISLNIAVDLSRVLKCCCHTQNIYLHVCKYFLSSRRGSHRHVKMII